MYREWFRIRAVLVAAISLALLFLIGMGCLAETESKRGDVVELRLWGVPTKDATDVYARSSRAVFERFSKLHPNIRIVSGTGLKISGPASESGLLMAMAGGTAPDVFYVNFRQLELYVNQGFLYPLDEYLKKDPQILDNIHPEIKKVIEVKGKDGKLHYYSIPHFQCVMALYYRKDLFKAAGLDPNKPPRNWNEFYDYAQKLTIPEKGQWGFGFINAPQCTSWHWINLLWQAGGEAVVKDGKGKWKAAFNTPAGVTALNFYRKLISGEWTRDGKTYKGVACRTTTWDQDINRGKIGMWFFYTFELQTNTNSNLNPHLIGIGALPAGPTGIRANEINAGMWGMNATIKDKRIRDAAWEYMKFMGSEESNRIRTKVFVESGYAKMVNPVYLKKFGYEEYLTGIPSDWIAANQQAFRYGKPEPHGENCQMIYTEMDQPLQEAQLFPKADAMALLNKSVKTINNRLLGYRPKEEMARKRNWSLVVVIALALLIGGVSTRQVKLLAQSQGASQGTQVAKGPSYHMIAWLFMLPAVLSVLIWAYYPLLRGMLMAFQDYRILGGSKWVGLDNFIECFSQESFWKGLLNSGIYVVMSLVMGFFAPIILAFMLHEVPRGKLFFRTIYYLPAVTAPLVTVLLWRQFYDPTPNGLFNKLIQQAVGNVNSLGHLLHIGAMSNWHVATQTFLDNPQLAMACIILPTIWAGAGPGSIIYLAALKSIPEELFEAADLDGAGIFTKAFRMCFPLLKPLIIINLVGAFIGSFKAMENILVMTGGGPVYATHTMGLEIWYNAFMYLKYGYATAAAWIMGSMLIGFTMYQLRILRHVRFTTAGRQ